MLERACALVKGWLENADTERRMMALEALQVAVTATREAAEVTGVLPIEAASVYHDRNNHPDARRPVNNGIARGIPFSIMIALAC